MFRNLSETEKRIMRELWKIGEPVSANELQRHFYEQNTDWKIQTISTFLARMEQKGFVSSAKKGKSKVYTPMFSEAEMKGIEARGFLENYYEGSLKKFLVAFSKGKISEEKAASLEQWLDEQEEGE